MNRSLACALALALQVVDATGAAASPTRLRPRAAEPAETTSAPDDEEIAERAAGPAEGPIARPEMAFGPNVGQTDERVRFISRGAGYTLFLADDEVVVQARVPKADRSGAAEAEKVEADGAAVERELATVRMRFAGTASAGEVEGEGQLPGTVNYFLGNDPQKWPTRIPTYSKVCHRNLYPGIDAIYYGDGGQLEYDFVVAPGANYRAIRLEYEGAAVSVDERGDVQDKCTRNHKRTKTTQLVGDVERYL